jgi:hypothetical protein
MTTTEQKRADLIRRIFDIDERLADIASQLADDRGEKGREWRIRARDAARHYRRTRTELRSELAALFSPDELANAVMAMA